MDEAIYMRTAKRLIGVSSIFILAFDLSGCAFVPSYENKTPGPTAQIQNSEDFYILKNAKKCTHPARTPGKPMFSGKMGYTTIPANTLVTLLGNSTDYDCAKTVISFVPKPNNKYIVSYLPTNHRTCATKIFNVTQNKNIPVIFRKYKNGVVYGNCDDAYSEQ